MTNGWRIRRNAIAVGEMSKTPSQTGRHLTKGDSENHSRDQWSLLGNGCKLSDFYTGQVKAPPIWKESVTWTMPRIRICLGYFGRGHWSWAVRRTQEGMSAELLQSGLDEKWLADSKECYCCLRDVQDLFADGKTPYQRRFGESFKWPVIPFGAMVEHHPIPTCNQMRINQFGKKYCLVSFKDMHQSRREFRMEKI